MLAHHYIRKQAIETNTLDQSEFFFNINHNPPHEIKILKKSSWYAVNCTRNPVLGQNVVRGEKGTLKS